MVIRSYIFDRHGADTFALGEVSLNREIADVRKAGCESDRYGSRERKLHPVVLRRIVRGGERDDRVDREAACSEVDHRGRGESEVDDIRTTFGQTADELFEK